MIATTVEWDMSNAAATMARLADSVRKLARDFGTFPRVVRGGKQSHKQGKYTAHGWKAIRKILEVTPEILVSLVPLSQWAHQLGILWPYTGPGKWP